MSRDTRAVVAAAGSTVSLALVADPSSAGGDLFYMTNGSALGVAPGAGPKSSIDVLVGRAVGGNPFKPFGTWSITF